MNILREEGLVLRPPLLEDSNYSYWKNEKQEVILKPEDLRTTLDNELASYNSKALNAIFSAVDSNQFRLIATCETAKEAWDILQVAYEGTASVRLSKLQMLAFRFENLRMEDNKTIVDFNAKLCDITNECHALGEKYDDIKLVRKTLRSLPDRFAHKVTAIEEAKDVTIIHLDELIGSLETFEMNLKQNKIEKDKGIVLQAEAHETEDDAQTDDQDMTDSVVLLTKNFQKFLKNQKSKGGKNSDTPRYKSASNSSSFSNDKKDKQIQYRECEGYGHIQSECANILKKKKRRSLNITWSDVDSNDNKECDDVVSNRVALSAKQDRIIVELTCQTTKLQYELNQFKLQIVEKDMLFKSTTAELEMAKASLSRINTGKIKLDEILSTGQVGGNRQGINYIGECSNTKMYPKSKIEFVKSTVSKPSIIDYGKKKNFQKPRPRRYVPICHYCHISSHIYPKYFELKNNLQNEKHVRTSFSGQFEHGLKSASKHTPKIKIQLKDDFPRRIWIRKSDLRCNVANISLKASTCEFWYFDSGCYRHMTSNKNNLSNFQSIEKSRILDKGMLDVKGLPRLKNVLLIEGLKIKLISISQLCDQNLFVHFTKDLYQVFDDTNCYVMTGKRSAGNCYLLEHHMSCLNITHDETEIWYQNLGHLNFKSLYNLVNTGAVLGMPKLSKKKDGVCGPVCARYQSDPKESHLKAVKRIMRYVNGTSDYGIWYSKDTNSNLAGFICIKKVLRYLHSVMSYFSLLLENLIAHCHI
ncbi:hypothetical protein Pfo_027396 [Paulownia fortunei]|nr:hypothetical protein Pfo_027396 [Paulownia fortunei]